MQSYCDPTKKMKSTEIIIPDPRQNCYKERRFTKSNQFSNIEDEDEDINIM
jgi:hypothetical protein